MLSWAAAFLVIALLAALLGFAGIAGTAAWTAKVLFVIFLVLSLVALIFGRKPVRFDRHAMPGDTVRIPPAPRTLKAKEVERQKRAPAKRN
jgi:uncharacterized membrane protein YtjA (UPF0391 family)